MGGPGGKLGPFARPAEAGAIPAYWQCCMPETGLEPMGEGNIDTPVTNSPNSVVLEVSAIASLIPSLYKLYTKLH